MGSVVEVTLTRGELVALKETIERTPRFQGRTEVRDAITGLLRRSPRPNPAPLSLDDETVAALVRSVVPTDVMSVTIRTKLNRAIATTR